MKIFVQNFKIGVQSLIYESLPLRIPGRENLCFKIQNYVDISVWLLYELSIFCHKFRSCCHKKMNDTAFSR